MANEYATLAELKQALMGSNTAFSGDDTDLTDVLTAVSRQIDGHCQRDVDGGPGQFWQDTVVVTREYYADDPTSCFTDDISTTTGLVVKVDEDDDGTFETTLTITTNFVLLPLNAAGKTPARPYYELRIVDTTGGSAFPILSSGRPGVQVTAKFGWTAIPEDVNRACLIQSAQAFKGTAAPFGGVELGEGGGVIRLRQQLHPMAEALLVPFTKARVA